MSARGHRIRTNGEGMNLRCMVVVAALTSFIVPRRVALAVTLLASHKS